MAEFPPPRANRHTPLVFALAIVVGLVVGAVLSILLYH
jgi:hypothetical protein